jgi:hypothetical protein
MSILYGPASADDLARILGFKPFPPTELAAAKVGPSTDLHRENRFMIRAYLQSAWNRVVSIFTAQPDLTSHSQLQSLTRSSLPDDALKEFTARYGDQLLEHERSLS